VIVSFPNPSEGVHVGEVESETQGRVTHQGAQPVFVVKRGGPMVNRGETTKSRGKRVSAPARKLEESMVGSLHAAFSASPTTSCALPSRILTAREPQ